MCSISHIREHRFFNTMSDTNNNISNVVEHKHGQEAPDREDTTKKLAQHGQWRTPPLPVFTASAATATDGGASSALPTSADEYALMLQEADKHILLLSSAQKLRKHILPILITSSQLLCQQRAAIILYSNHSTISFILH